MTTEPQTIPSTRTISLAMNASGSQIAADSVDLQSQINTINSSISNLQAQITSNDTDITDLQSRITAVESDIATLKSNDTDLYDRINLINTQITDLQSADLDFGNQLEVIRTEQINQNQAISDLNSRVYALETGTSSDGPFIGDIVHVRNNEGHCLPAIVYEDWDGQNGFGVISAAVILPNRLELSPWDSYIELIPDYSGAEPFVTWHWPEGSFSARRKMFGGLKVAT